MENRIFFREMPRPETIKHVQKISRTCGLFSKVDWEFWNAVNKFGEEACTMVMGRSAMKCFI